MKMLDINGQSVNVDIKPSSYPLRYNSKSRLQGIVSQKLQELFPRESILEEFFIPKAKKLSVDFFIPRLGVVIEVSPENSQHEQYIPFYHGQKTMHKFAKQINHDVKKRQWSDYNNFNFIVIKTEEDLECLKNL